MRIAVPREIHAGERRVATTPEVVRQILKLGFEVSVEAGAGAHASFSDEAYTEAGASVVSDTRALWNDADIVLKVRAPERHPELGCDEVELLRSGQTLISFVWPGQNEELMQRLAATGANVLAMDSVPRISRAQKMDALSSMANIGGYRAVIEAANHFGRFFTGQITAAGKVPPAKVMIIGAGVGYGSVDLENHANATAQVDDDGGAFGYHLDAGIGIDITDSLSIEALYRYSSFLDVEVTSALGSRSDVDVDSHQGLGGLRYKF